ncbi:hypothetical protein Poli38472_001751 [Pythium oligandrum]|uniref:subtilisin n=1 Tax=Pythium oligandrum TaxID=41045 RepID=A0A8K1CU14_PYTOL|nr:hypothetical protein Poli38472_001751 [Pythium oligandrum]|eukprot:TMW69595.1 hypothetical protein Poli38472_001751 [Pythium oligandrum]
MVSARVFALTALATAVSTASASVPHVDAGVHRTLRRQGTVNLIVTMKQSTESALASIHEAEYTSRGARIDAIVNRLEKHAKSSQKDISQLTTKEATTTSGASLFASSTSFWISNEVSFKGATPELLNKLMTLPNIAKIREERVYSLDVVAVAAANSTISEDQPETEWGIRIVQAPEVWATGNKGEGIVIGGIDTGVQFTHEALRDNYRGEYGWFDPQMTSKEPFDNYGHGTHTMGTIAGAKGIGVAPGVKWMACKGCGDECLESDLLACAQFMTCPTDADGNNRDCSKAPAVVSNSWSTGRGDNMFRAAVDAWHAAGIIPIFSAGNLGPGCGTIRSPGEYDNVIGVGATSSNDSLADLSSKGPGVLGTTKPDLSAPGHDVRSSWSFGDDEYAELSGTSMAVPHVTGIVALLLKAKPGLTFTEVREILQASVDTESLLPTGLACGDIPDGVFPNNGFGYGRINARKAVNLATGSTPAPSQ